MGFGFDDGWWARSVSVRVSQTAATWLGVNGRLALPFDFVSMFSLPVWCFCFDNVGMFVATRVTSASLPGYHVVPSHSRK